MILTSHDIKLYHVFHVFIEADKDQTSQLSIVTKVMYDIKKKIEEMVLRLISRIIQTSSCSELCLELDICR